ncbi:MAG: hypothetical protein WKF75_00785 [Singulisphaera sp.]
MMYRFPTGLATYPDGTPFATDWNLDLSEDDRKFIAAIYRR